MTTPDSIPNPCAGCRLGQARIRLLPEVNDIWDSEVAAQFEDVPDNSEVHSTRVSPEEQSLGEIGSLIDMVAEITKCEGPKFSIKIGRLSLVSVCRRTWNYGQRVGPILFSFHPTIIDKK